MNLQKQLGFYFGDSSRVTADRRLIQYINLKLAVLGCPVFRSEDGSELQEIASPLLANHREKDRLLAHYLCPADQRIHRFLSDHLADVLPEGGIPFPSKTFVLDRHGLARALSLPPDRDSFFSKDGSSYRIKQGVLHNPKADRRTTHGVFHIAAGGLPVPDDKKEVPKKVYAELLLRALRPPQERLRLPFTSTQSEQAETFVSLLLRPKVAPEVPGIRPAKSSEIRFFAPGNLVSNLDFVESIFGNAGDPFLSENDAGLDVEHWSGHTGCVILATHLLGLKKKELGLPHEDEATPRQKRDGMCWRNEDELYNDGSAFKVTCRTDEGVMVTIIADSYFGYCKKEVKTQISYAANLMGNCEEEHAGGALAFPSYDLGDVFRMPRVVRGKEYRFADVVEQFGGVMDLHEEGFGTDRKFPDVVYVPEDTVLDLQRQKVSWMRSGQQQGIKLLPSKTYVGPSGYKVHMEKPPGGRAWRLIGTVAEGTFCHKPSTVSGGGKSEISKPITDAILQGPVVVGNVKEDFDRVEEILKRDYADRFKPEFRKKVPSRPILSPDRSLGSVIKLLTPSQTEFTDDYNQWLQSIPNYVKELVFVVKRFYDPAWGGHWREHFGVDIINGQPGHELKVGRRKLVSNYIRVGYEHDGAWRVFGLRKDFSPSKKLQLEDDISVSIVVARDRLKKLNPDYSEEAVKLVTNCEYRLFQRPDEAIHPGYDKQTEADFAQPNCFLSNYEPLTKKDAQNMVEDAITFEQFTPPMRELIRSAASMESPEYFVSSAHPRVVDGKPSKNPRYLQDRPDLIDARGTYLSEIGTRLFRRVPMDEPLSNPVNAILPGRRNNPADPQAGIRPLAVYNPIHYQELPELFMEFISSLTGKSPSTTGAGSEGALTKGPFNALLPITDLNNALVSYVLTGYSCFTTAAGFIGPEVRVDHDISLLVPEIWSRMTVKERDPRFLIENGYMESVDDFEYEGRLIPASRLGYRITDRFLGIFFGRMFNSPDVIFDERILRPETQNMEAFVDGLDNIVSTQKRVAEMYFNDGSIELACPPLKALLHIMRDGHFDGRDVHHAEVRFLFTRDSLLLSDWYRGRLEAQQVHDVRLWERHIRYLESFTEKQSHAEEIERLNLTCRLEEARRELDRVRDKDYLEELSGSLGMDRVQLPVAMA